MLIFLAFIVVVLVPGSIYMLRIGFSQLAEAERAYVQFTQILHTKEPLENYLERNGQLLDRKNWYTKRGARNCAIGLALFVTLILHLYYFGEQFVAALQPLFHTPP